MSPPLQLELEEPHHSGRLRRVTGLRLDATRGRRWVLTARGAHKACGFSPQPPRSVKARQKTSGCRGLPTARVQKGGTKLPPRPQLAPVFVKFGAVCMRGVPPSFVRAIHSPFPPATASACGCMPEACAWAQALAGPRRRRHQSPCGHSWAGPAGAITPGRHGAVRSGHLAHAVRPGR